MNPAIQSLVNSAKNQSDTSEIWAPERIDPQTREGQDRLNQLTASGQVFVYNEIENQLGEYIRCIHPTEKFDKEKLAHWVSDHIKPKTRWDYGLWFYYPWSSRLVHFIPENEFMTTRTSRNVYKITPEEREILSTKKIGVAGLSVGQSVSLVLAMERCFGELRIADFDVLELSNLNRIRSGAHNLGINKGVAVAREILEIDPYLRLKVFTDGLTDENLERFFSGDGNLDLMVDEIDGLDIKILLRYKARSLRIPVVMDMSDKGTLDVERFDLEPDRPILHGWIDHLDHTRIKGLSNEDKIPYLLPMLHLPTLTKRLKASMMEVGQSITTWPQLASSVALGGALAADTIRRIFLGQFHSSGRYQVDLEEIVSDPVKSEAGFSPIDYSSPELSSEMMISLAEQFLTNNKCTGDAKEEEVRSIVEDACHAPSAGNNQPWKWLGTKGCAFLFHDKARSYGWTDPDGSMADIGLGAALENFRISARVKGYNSEISYAPLGEDSQLVAAIALKKADPEKDELAAMLRRRCTNRKLGSREDFAEQDQEFLKKCISSLSDFTLEFATTREQISSLSAVVGNAERLRMLQPQGHYEFFNKEVRWTKAEAERTRDGLDLETMELRPQDVSGMEIAADPEAVALLAQWKKGNALRNISGRAILSSSAVGLITMPENTHLYRLEGGRAVQRVWLAANLRGWAFHPISAPIFFMNRVEKQGHGLDEEMVAGVKLISKEMRELFNSLELRKGLFLFRLSRAEEPSAVALRRRLDEVYVVKH